MPKADNAHTTSRRTLLSTAALVAPASLLPALAAAAEQAPDPHPAWLAAILTKRHLINSRDGGVSDEQAEALFEEEIELEDRLYLTPSRTLAGVRAQLAGAVEAIEHSAFGDAEEAGLRTALAALERLAGEGTA